MQALELRGCSHGALQRTLCRRGHPALTMQRSASSRVSAAPPVRVSAAPRQVQEDSDPFFNREREIAMLEDVLNMKPECVILLNGPPNCGKSALLQEIVTRRTLDLPPSGNKQDFLVLDLRTFDTTNPAAFASLLGNQLAATSWWDQVIDRIGAAGAKLTTPVAVSMELNLKVTASDPAQMPLGQLQQVLGKWINSAAGNLRPVIIIDEANRLCDWKDKDAAALQGLLDMFVQISKQTGKCHVILATSDDFMVYWLQEKGLRPDQYVAKTLGNFTEEDAKIFVYGSPKLWDDSPPDAPKRPNGGAARCWPGLWPFGAGPADFHLPDEVWPQLYSVCGGNAKALRNTVADAVVNFNADAACNVEESWRKAFKTKRMSAAAHVARGFAPNILSARGGQDAAWTREQWAITLQEITDAKYHAVPVSRLTAQLGRGDTGTGEAVLKSLVRFNMVSYRQESSIAFDLPPEVFGVEGQESEAVITAPYPAFLECILRGHWKKKAEAAVVGSSKESGGQGTAVEQQLEDITAAIRDVEVEVKKVEGKMEELELSKPEGWQQQVAYLHNKEAQLRNKEAQLREKELLLLRSPKQS